MRAILGSYDSELTPAEYSPQLTRRMREAEDMVQKVHAHSSEMEVSGPASVCAPPGGAGGAADAVACRPQSRWGGPPPAPASTALSVQALPCRFYHHTFAPRETLVKRDSRGRLPPTPQRPRCFLPYELLPVWHRVCSSSLRGWQFWHFQCHMLRLFACWR